jgi:NADH-quinone oxidoreductase subunit N
MTLANGLGFAPELWLLGGTLVILGMTFARSMREGRAPTIVALVAVAGGLLSLATQLRTPLNIANSSFVLDGYAILLDVVMLLAVGLVLLLSLADAGPTPAGATRIPAFVLLGTCGGMLLVSAANLLSFFAAQELLFVSVLIAIGLRETRGHAMIGSLVAGLAGSAIVGYGLAVAYGASGETALAGIGRVLASRGAHDLPTVLVLVLVVGGAAFRLTAVPFRWLSDDHDPAASGIRALSAALLVVAGFGALQRVVVLVFGPTAVPWPGLLAGLAAVLITGGTIGVLGERRLSRALAFAGIGQVGFILMGLAAARQASGVAGVAVLLCGAAPAILAAAVPTGRLAESAGARRLHEFAGIVRRAPLPALALALGAGSLAGLPPLAGFFGRLLVLVGALESGFAWLALVGLVNLLVMGGWAVRVVRLLALEAPAIEASEAVPGVPASIGLAVVSAGVGAVGLLLSPIVNAAATVAGPLPR